VAACAALGAALVYFLIVIACAACTCGSFVGPFVLVAAVTGVRVTASGAFVACFILIALAPGALVRRTVVVTTVACVGLAVSRVA
jgi:hypothetical protein